MAGFEIIQYGDGTRDYNGISQVYIGSPNQRGHGIGSFLGGLFRRVLSFLKSGAKALGKEALKSGINIATDVLDHNVPVKEALSARARESDNNLKRKAQQKIDSLMSGSGYVPGQLAIASEFVVQGQGDEYIDLAHTIISLRVSITRETPVAASATPPKVGPINNFMHSIFNQVDVLFNQKRVSTPNNLYAYRAYIETLLSYGLDAKKSHLSTVGWCCDTPGKMDSVDDDNLGLKKRRDLLTCEKSADFIGHLHCDIFNQERFLINGVEMRLRLTRARETFCLMDGSPNGCNFVITEASLIVRRAKISPGILLAHARMLAKTTVKYPLTRVEVKAVSIPAGVHGETIDNVILGQIPRSLIIGFVDNKAFNGDRTMNPFNFQHFGINYLSLYVDGRQVPSKPLQPDFSNSKLYVDAYHTLFSSTGIHFLNEGNTIDRFDYPNGFCLYTFDLTPDLSANSNSHWNLIHHGTVRIEVRFDKGLESTVNCIVYAEYESVLEIDASRQVTIDFAG
ncbi:uncharacterized protein F54H12.2-like [Microplitis mediator]|uniref:uncharacterized protein F54H12.2-like n=1 Tax=Microplitis mediator TaxID=375433 RepID=UPI002553DFB9|nr:uncharacterized protein F54H12.2-like [Microplitis mediator]